MADRTISSIELLNNSVNGNPRFLIEFDDGSTAHTQSDASFAYAVGNPGMREGDAVTVEFSRAGKIKRMAPKA